MICSGNVSDAYQLEGVYVVLRHGSRSPLYKIPNLRPPKVSCLLSHSNNGILAKTFTSAMDKQVKEMKQISVFHWWSTYPNRSKCSSAQLTNVGALQMIRLGQLFKSIYVDKWKLIERNEQESLNRIFVHSTKYPRTVQSAVAFLYGVIPSLNLTAIRISLTSNLLFCTSTDVNLPCICQAAYKLESEMKSAAKSALNRSNTLRKEIAQIVRVRSSRLPWMSAMLEVLSTYVCHGQRLPCVKDRCFTWDIIQNMWNIHDKEDAQKLLNPIQERVSRLVSHPFLHQLVHRLLNKARSTSNERFVLYFGHDKTLLYISKALGIHDGRWPPYASRLVFELYKRNSLFYIRVLFNGIDKTYNLTFCSPSNLVGGLCPLENFVYFVLYQNIKFFGKASFKNACTI